MPVYFFSGKENYLKKQEIRKIAEQIECPELNVMEFHEPCPELYDFIYTAPFIGCRKVVVLYYFPEQEEFLAAAKGLPKFTDIYIISGDFPDHRKKVVKELTALTETREFKKISEDLLFKCISSRLQRLGFPSQEIQKQKDILMDAFRGYSQCADMDLEVVQKHVQMIAFSGSLTPETIRIFAPDSSDYKAFRLATMLLSGEKTCVDFAGRLVEQGEKPIGMLSLIAYQIRICIKAVLFREENYLSLIGIKSFQLFKDFEKYSAADYVRVYEVLMEGIRRIKKGEKSSAVLTDCIMSALAILKEE